MELISIIVPIYNSEDFLDKTISSILSQTYQNIEILLIDDGSKDKSLEIANRYKNKDNRIKVLSHKNSGQSFTRNKGIEMSTGEYIVFIDSDDWVDERFVENMHKEISRTQSDIVVCDYLISYPQGLKEISYNFSDYQSGLKSFELILNGEISHTCWGKMYKSTLIKDSSILFPVGRTNEDLYTVAIWFLQAHKVVFIKDFLLTSRDREGSITNSFSNNFIDLLYILKQLKEYLIENNLIGIFEQQYKRKYQKMVVYLLNYGVRMNRVDFIKKVLNTSEISLNDFDMNLLTKKEKIAVLLINRSINLYFIFTRIYYKIFAKNIFIIK